jgi:thioredoxin-related protein
MTLRLKTMTLVVLALNSGMPVLHAREWINHDGQKLIADLLEVVDAKTIKLRSAANGRIYNYPIEKLSANDQKFVQNYIQAKSQQAATLLIEKSGPKPSKRRAKWTEDYEEAQNEAKEHDLPILLLFTGSDWCGYCIQLEAGVFSKRDFEKFADRNIVLMKADFPRAKQKSAIKKQNAELKKEFKASGYPSVFILSPKGKTLGRIHGYGGSMVDEYIDKIEKIIR